MIIPGFPVMLGGGGKPPFAFSGSWETGDEGWSRTSVNHLNNPSQARSGAFSFVITGSAGANAEYVIPADIAGGMSISVSAWHKAVSGSTQRAIQYRIGSGSFVALATVTDASTSYAEMSGSFSNPGEDQVTIRITGTTGLAVIFDDWSISGTAL